MKKKQGVFFLTMCTMFLFTQCTYRSKAIVEPRFGTYSFTTYTVDTFRFRVILNGEVLTDSLLSPQGDISKVVSFFDPQATLLIVNTKNNQVIVDSALQLRTGTTIFSLVQFEHNQTPYLPSLPNEPPPQAGNYKIRFQYTPFPGDPTFQPQPFFYDSVMCIIRNNGVDIDTIVLQKNEMTSFYEATGNGGATFSIRLVNPENGDLIDASTSPSVGAAFTGFNTVSVSGRAVTDDWRLIRIY